MFYMHSKLEVIFLESNEVIVFNQHKKPQC